MSHPGNIKLLSPAYDSLTAHQPLRRSTIKAGYQQRNPQPTAALQSRVPRRVCHPFSTNRSSDYHSHHWSVRAFISSNGAVEERRGYKIHKGIQCRCFSTLRLTSLCGVTGFSHLAAIDQLLLIQPYITDRNIPIISMLLSLSVLP